MPQYFFHILNTDSDPIPDDEGQGFEDLETARHEAVLSVRDLAIDAIRAGRNLHGLAIEITDEDGKVLDTIRASEILD
jgi:hypothetical protein